MRFEKIEPRTNWVEQTTEFGYLSSVLDNPPYWIEAAEQPFCVALTMEEIEDGVETATVELNQLAVEAVKYVCASDRSEELMKMLRIPIRYRDAIRNSWRRHDRSLYGRFDFAYSDGVCKLLELNFDTPTSLYEAAVLQWTWLEDLRNTSRLPASADQFNSIHERLVAAFKKIVSTKHVLHLASIADAPEDEDTVRYIESCAHLAGLETKFLYMSDLGVDSFGRLVDLQDKPIHQLFKLYPWEHLMKEDALVGALKGRVGFLPLIEDGRLQCIEPLWKALLSNKGILPIMWELAPNHPNLLPASFDDHSALAAQIRKQQHVRKPIFGREGSNVSIVIPDKPQESVFTGGEYGAEGYILQKFHGLPRHEDWHAVLGSWVIDNQPAGMGIRVDKSRITTNSGCFVPHFIC